MRVPLYNKGANRSQFAYQEILFNVSLIIRIFSQEVTPCLFVQYMIDERPEDLSFILIFSTIYV